MVSMTARIYFGVWSVLIVITQYRVLFYFIYKTKKRKSVFR